MESTLEEFMKWGLKVKKNHMGQGVISNPSIGFLTLSSLFVSAVASLALWRSLDPRRPKRKPPISFGPAARETAQRAAGTRRPVSWTGRRVEWYRPAVHRTAGRVF